MASTRDVHESRKGLLDGRERDRTRTSVDEAYQSSSDDDTELDELHGPDNKRQSPYKYVRTRRHRQVEAGSDIKPYEGSSSQASRQQSCLRFIRRCGTPRTTYLLIIGILLGGLILLIGGGSLWIYKNAPEDGVSQSSSEKFLSSRS